METTVHIPTNYTDAGRLFGMFEIRNAIECVIICVPLIWLVFSLTTFRLMTTLVIACVLVIPAGGFALMGIGDHSLFTFIKLYLKWRKNRGILLYRGSKPVAYKEVLKCQN